MENGQNRKRIRWWKIPLGILLIALLCAGGYFAYVFATYSRIEDRREQAVVNNTEEEARTGEEYTVVSYNLGFGAYTWDYTFFMDEGKESKARSKDSVIECISETADTSLSFDPDFVLFQEVDTDSTRSHHVNQVEMIQEKYAGQGTYDNVFALNYHSAFLMYPVLDPIGASNSGLLTMSRKSISSALRRSLPIATGFNKFIDLDRCYLVSRIPVDGGKELVLVNVHLSAYGTDAAQGNAQLTMLFEDMEEEYAKGNYVVIGGDFNHDFTTDSKEYFNPDTDKEYSWCHEFPDELIPDGFKKCTDYAEGMISSSRYTNIPFGEDSFTVILDGFIVSDNVECRYVQNVDTGYLYSDHNPVVMKFVLK